MFIMSTCTEKTHTCTGLQKKKKKITVFVYVGPCLAQGPVMLGAVRVLIQPLEVFGVCTPEEGSVEAGVFPCSCI